MLAFMSVIAIELQTCLVDRQPRPRAGKACARLPSKPAAGLGPSALSPTRMTDFKGWGPGAF